MSRVSLLGIGAADTIVGIRSPVFGTRKRAVELRGGSSAGQLRGTGKASDGG